jgi:hypothetical protein
MPPVKGSIRAKVHYGRRFEVSAWIPPKRLSDLAHDRIEGLVGYFLSCAHKRDCVKWQDDLYNLARSCYLQGVNDAVDTAARLRLREHRGEGSESD